MLHVWIPALMSATYCSFNTSRGKDRGETVTLNCFPKSLKGASLHMCASAYKHHQCLIIWQSTACCHQAPPCPRALGTSYQSKMGPTVRLTVMRRVENRTKLYLEIIEALSHVEGPLLSEKGWQTPDAPHHAAQKRSLLVLLLLQYSRGCKWSPFPLWIEP